MQVPLNALVKIRSLLLLLLGSTWMLATPVAQAVKIEGQAWQLAASQTQTPIAVNDHLKVGQTICTHAKSRILLQWHTGTRVVLGPKTCLILKDMETIEQQEGEAYFLSNTLKAGTAALKHLSPNQFRVKTKTATIGIRGTEFIVKTNDEEAVLLKEGFVDIAAKKGTFEHYKQSGQAGIDAQKAAFEAYKKQSEQAFNDYKAQLAYEFQAFVENIPLEPMQSVTLKGRKAYERPIDKTELARFETYRRFFDTHLNKELK